MSKYIATVSFELKINVPDWQHDDLVDEGIDVMDYIDETAKQCVRELIKNDDIDEDTCFVNIRKEYSSSNDLEKSKSEHISSKKKEYYNKNGEEIVKNIFRRNKLDCDPQLSEKEIDEIAKKIKIDYSKLYNHELWFCIYKKLEEVGKALLDCTDAITDNDRSLLHEIIDASVNNKSDKNIIECFPDNYIMLSTGKIIWYSLNKSCNNCNEACLPDMI